jgi:hypothetical protein
MLGVPHVQVEVGAVRDWQMGGDCVACVSREIDVGHCRVRPNRKLTESATIRAEQTLPVSLREVDERRNPSGDAEGYVDEFEGGAVRHNRVGDATRAIVTTQYKTPADVMVDRANVDPKALRGYPALPVGGR